MVAWSRQKRPGTRKKKITIVSPSVAGAKQMGSPEPAGMVFAAVRGRVAPAAARLSPDTGSAIDNRAVAAGKGHESIPQNGDPLSPMAVAGGSGCQTIGKRYWICMRHPGRLGFATSPLEDLTFHGGLPLRSYGAAATIIGRAESGCQNNSMSLLIGSRCSASRRRTAGIGPDRRKTKSR